MASAKTHGIYVLNGHRYRIKKGDPLPDGAVMWGGPDKPDVTEHGIQNAGKKAEKPAEVADEPTVEVAEAPAKRDRKAAPENRAKADEAETR